MSIVNNLLPRDTRPIEACSSISLMCMGILAFALIIYEYPFMDAGGLMLVQSIHFWAVMLGLIGLLQYIAVVIHPHAELLRTIAAWITGSLWIWLGLSAQIGHVDPNDIAALGLGVANYYAFVLNSTTLFKSWK